MSADNFTNTSVVTDENHKVEFYIANKDKQGEAHSENSLCGYSENKELLKVLDLANFCPRTNSCIKSIILKVHYCYYYTWDKL